VGAGGVWSAPGRVNLIGEHTDYSEGFVLPVAIGMRTRVAASTRTDDGVHVRSAQGAGATPYVVGAVRAVREHGIDVPGLDVAVDGDIPIGAGLSSSAALTCATALAAAELAGADLPPATIARIAQRAENDYVGVACGVMDQMAAMCARAGHALLLDCRTLAVDHVPLPLADAGLALLVIDTRVRHDLTDSAYGDRRRSVEKAARLLGVEALRDLTVDDLTQVEQRLDDKVLFRRVRHVVTENQRVRDTVALLRDERPGDIGPLLVASHESLRDDFAVSHPALDVVVQAALAAGALGARMTGAGFGGSVVALVPVALITTVTAAATAAASGAGYSRPEAFTAEPAAGARRDS
jgi:galactokinase